MWAIPFALLILFELMADTLSKHWSLGHSWIFAAAALAAYLIGNAFWLYALKTGIQLSRGAVLFSVASALLAVLIGVLVFREKVSHTQVAGFVLGLAAIGLLSE